MSDTQDRTLSMPHCGRCSIPGPERVCRAEKGKGPVNCPSLRHKKTAHSVRPEMPLEEVEFMRQAAIQECAGYTNREKGYALTTPAKPRVVEIVEFARRMGYKKLGLIFCAGTTSEAGIFTEILETNGFTVVSAICKAGKTPKSDYGITQEQQIDLFREQEPICNPKFQAILMNESKVDFTILLGLCVGHDSIVFKHIESPATVLAVKDRLTGHNPLAPIYMYNGYYRYLKHPLPLSDE